MKVYHKILNIVPCAIYSRIFLSIHPIYTSLHLLISNSQPNPLLCLQPTPLATTSLFFISLILFLFHSWVHLCHIRSWVWTIFTVFIKFFTTLFVFYFLLFGHEACGIWAPRPGIKPASTELEGEVLTTGPPGKSHYVASYIHIW